MALDVVTSSDCSSNGVTPGGVLFSGLDDVVMGESTANEDGFEDGEIDQLDGQESESGDNM